MPIPPADDLDTLTDAALGAMADADLIALNQRLARRAWIAHGHPDLIATWGPTLDRFYAGLGRPDLLVQVHLGIDACRHGWGPPAPSPPTPDPGGLIQDPDAFRRSFSR